MKKYVKYIGLNDDNILSDINNSLQTYNKRFIIISGGGKVDKNLLKYYINRAESTQKELAEYMGISLSALQYKMRGRIRWTIEDAKKIKECLGLSNDEFLRLLKE